MSYDTDDNMAKLHTKVRSLWQGSMAFVEYALELSTRTLSCGSLYDEKSLEALFVEEATHQI